MFHLHLQNDLVVANVVVAGVEAKLLKLVGGHLKFVQQTNVLGRLRGALKRERKNEFLNFSNNIKTFLLVEKNAS